MSPVIPSAGRVRALLRRLGRTSDERIRAVELAQEQADRILQQAQSTATRAQDAAVAHVAQLLLLEQRCEGLERKLKALAEANVGPDLAARVERLEAQRFAPSLPDRSERDEVVALLERLAGAYRGEGRVALLEAATRVGAGERAGGGR